MPHPPRLLLEGARGLPEAGFGDQSPGSSQMALEGWQCRSQPRNSPAANGGEGLGLLNRSLGPGLQGLCLGGDFLEGQEHPRTLSGISGWWGRPASGLRDGSGEAEGPGRQEEAWGGGRARRRVPPDPSKSEGCSGRGGASPRIWEVELCKACSPIFWMALKYTSAASDRAAWGQRMGLCPAPPHRLHLPPPSGDPSCQERADGGDTVGSAIGAGDREGCPGWCVWTGGIGQRGKAGAGPGRAFPAEAGPRGSCTEHRDRCRAGHRHGFVMGRGAGTRVYLCGGWGQVCSDAQA